mgnify:CR=1 FL=1
MLGYPPLIGGMTGAVALTLPIMGFSLKTPSLMILSVIYLLIYVPLTIKQVKSVKEKKIDVFDSLIAQSKLKKNYSDETNILEIIKSTPKKR